MHDAATRSMLLPSRHAAVGALHLPVAGEDS
jgi:hypothetical protein